MKRIYFAYPYSSDPLERTKEICDLVRSLLEVRKDVVPLIPHIMFDALYDYPTGYDHAFMLGWELEVIESADYICLPPVPEGVPGGCGRFWERAFAFRVGTPEVDWDYLMDGGEI